jgi:hypothetical protein
METGWCGCRQWLLLPSGQYVKKPGGQCLRIPPFRLPLLHRTGQPQQQHGHRRIR